MPQVYSVKSKQIVKQKRQGKMERKVEDQERWLPVVGYEGIYLVSNMGNVKRIGISNGATAGKILKPVVYNKGYCCFFLSKKNKIKKFFAHRLVMRSFVGEPPRGMEVNHKNFNPKDNRLKNLEYVTRRENVLHSTLAGRMCSGEMSPFSKLKVENIKKILILKNINGLSCGKIGKIFNVSREVIYSITIGKTWSKVSGIKYVHTHFTSTGDEVKTQEGSKCDYV